jgi:hypothetical protein
MSCEDRSGIDFRNAVVLSNTYKMEIETCKMDNSGSGLGWWPCRHGNEPFVSIKGGKYPVQLGIILGFEERLCSMELVQVRITIIHTARLSYAIRILATRPKNVRNALFPLRRVEV